LSWTAPKTNWTKNDRFEVADWDRIRFNLEAMHNLAVNLFEAVEIAATKNKTVLSYLYASDLNTIENNLEAINAASVKLGIGERKTFTPNGSSIDYTELNRIESACLSIYRAMQSFIDKYYFCDDELYTDESVGII
jgi:hypothetical protein